MLIVVHYFLANCQYPSALGIVSFNDGSHGKGGSKGKGSRVDTGVSHINENDWLDNNMNGDLESTWRRKMTGGGLS